MFRLSASHMMFGAPCSAHGRCVHSSAAAARLPGCGLAARLASAAAPTRGCAHECLAAPGGVRKRARCGLRVQAIADERTDAALLEDALRASSLAEPVELDAAQAERQKLQQLLNRWGPVAARAQAAGCSCWCFWCAPRYLWDCWLRRAWLCGCLRLRGGQGLATSCVVCNLELHYLSGALGGARQACPPLYAATLRWLQAV